MIEHSRGHNGPASSSGVSGLAQLGTHDDLPMLTFTSAAVADHPVNAPTDDYLRTMAVGLREAHGWSAGQIGRYLAQFPGATGAWTSTAIEELAA